MSTFICKLYTFQIPAAAPYSEDYRISNDAERDWVNGYDALPHFRDWTSDNEANFLSFDHAMMITGFVNTSLIKVTKKCLASHFGFSLKTRGRHC